MNKEPIRRLPVTVLSGFGIGMDEAALRRRLDACLPTEGEMSRWHSCVAVFA